MNYSKFSTIIPKCNNEIGKRKIIIKCNNDIRNYIIIKDGYDQIQY